MNAFERNQKGSDLDVLYSVDPRRLSIKLCYTSISGEKVAEEKTTTFECFSYDAVVESSNVSDHIVELPALIDGMFYFGTEEEAQDFIKKQIGM